MGSSATILFIPQAEQDIVKLWGVAKKSRPDEVHCPIKELYAELKQLSSENEYITEAILPQRLDISPSLSRVASFPFL